MKAVVVIHKWFVSHVSWEQMEVEGDEETIRVSAQAICYKIEQSNSCMNANYYIVPIQDTEELIQPVVKKKRTFKDVWKDLFW